MATKTIKGRIFDLSLVGDTVTFKLCQPGEDAVANGSGDTAVIGANGAYEFQATETDLAGWYDVLAFDSDGNDVAVSQKGVFIPGDVAGDYLVDDPNYSQPQFFPETQRSADDTGDLLIMWPITGEDLTAQHSIDGAAYTNATGVITQTDLVTTDGMYIYSLSHSPNDRPTGEGIVLYKVIGSITRQFVLRVTPSLAKLNLIGTGASLVQAGAVAADGSISEIIIGDDYYASEEREFEWTVPAIAGFSLSNVTCFFGGSALGDASGSWRVEGEVTDAGSGNWKLTFDLPASATEDCEPGFYNWSAAVHHETNGKEITKVRKGKNNKTQLVRKYT